MRRRKHNAEMTGGATPPGVGLLAVALLLALAPRGAAQVAGTVETIAGAFAGYQDGNNLVSQLNTPMGMALDQGGNLFVADYGNNAIRRIRLSDEWVFTHALANRPAAVALNASGVVFSLNQGDGTVTSFDVFGNPRGALISGLAAPVAMTLLADGNLLVAERAGKIRKFSQTGVEGAGYQVSEGFPQLAGVAGLEDGTVLASDASAQVVWAFEKAGGVARVYAGTKNVAGVANGVPGVGRLNGPGQIAAGPSRTLVIADRLNHRVRVIACDGTLSTLYGVDPSQWESSPVPTEPQLYPGWADGSAEFAESRDPAGVAVSSEGRVYSSETYYHIIRLGVGLALPSCTGGGGGEPGFVPPPVFTPNTGWFPSGATVSITASNSPAGYGLDARLFYNFGPEDPGTNSFPVPVVNGVGELVFSSGVDLGALRVVAFVGATSSGVVRGAPTVVHTPVLSPSSGYFPMGVRISVTSSNAPGAGFPPGTQIYYTTDGSTPTTNSLPAVMDGAGNGTVLFRSAREDLRSLRVRVFTGPNGGVVISGQGPTISLPGVLGEVGVPAGLGEDGIWTGGVGSTLVIPVVANLRDGVSIRSLQFVVDVVAQAGSPRLEGIYQVSTLTISSNDFVQVRAATFEAPTTFKSVNGRTNSLAVAFVGTNTLFNVSPHATVAMLSLPIRPDADSAGARADAGDEYVIRVRNISATSDGVEARVLLTNMPPRRVVVRSSRYLAGDTSPAYWHNAADAFETALFGDGNLDNADVNSAVYASLGFRVPYDFSDAFNAMDVYPEDSLSPPIAGGDGRIRFLDWQTILRRALGFNLNSFYRERSASGELIPTRGPGAGSPALAAESLSAEADGVVWNRPAALAAGHADLVQQTRKASVPIYMRADPGVRVSGLQFVATVLGVEGAPSADGVTFAPANGMRPPSISGNSPPGVGPIPNVVYCVWGLGDFDPALSGEVLLGHVEFHIPPQTVTGRHYEVALTHTDGGYDPGDGQGLVGLDFETVRGSAWVLVPAGPSSRIPDEWRAEFFGSATAAAAAPELDQDGDGFSNFEEYLAGTHPLAPTWRARAQGGKFQMRWGAARGLRYVLERSAKAAGGAWSPVGSWVAAADGLMLHEEDLAAGEPRFFRLKIEN